MPDTCQRGYSVADLARRWRVGESKILGWIDRGELTAINVAANLSGRRQLRITPESVAAFEKRRSSASAPKPQSKRHRQAHLIDYYPD